MRALTVWQPHATMLALGLRTIETRGWPTSYRGTLLIHAAKKWDDDIADDCDIAGSQVRGVMWSLKLTENQTRMANTLWGKTRGCVLAIAELVDCKRIPEPCGSDFDQQWGGFGPGRWGFVLSDLRTLAKPIPAVGHQQLWTPNAELIEECKKAAQ